jgi:hypothetical protein
VVIHSVICPEIDGVGLEAGLTNLKRSFGLTAFDGVREVREAWP